MDRRFNDAVGPIDDAQRVEQVDPGWITHAIPNELFTNNVIGQLTQLMVQMRSNGGLRSAGVSDGGNDIVFIYNDTRIDAGQGNGVRIDGNSPAAVFFDICVFDNDRLTQVIEEYGSDYTGEHGRYAGALFKASNVAGIVAVQREIKPS